jgi:hypothetical protein|tara:strand:+ start:1622 stop:1804 length:183 start_codon:yes stop_codon:yes gene_type:complete
MSSKIIDWFKKKDNYIFILIFVIGLIVAFCEYGFLPTIIVFGVLIVLSYIIGILVGRFIK